MKKQKNQAAEELREMLPSLLLYNGLILLSVTVSSLQRITEMTNFLDQLI